ncbi:hypothetical protein FGO68_gene6923 [Halteria grandinella]|uniref:Uncharacterized protein n=1 Tax=Halteria grandinella TaxID=5974 RepID=A0A8J8P8U8_HALGN|nr:hypothetical protein FGO68_gene6923 [Halteria grandinella]
MRNQGIIINFDGNFNQSYLSIENNTFNDIYQAYQVFDIIDYSFDFNQNIFGRTDPYLQINHLISVINMTATLVIINNNFFRNLSITGPLINLAEQPGYFTTPFIIANNQFSTIQGLVNSNILQITRSILDDESDPQVRPPNVDMQPQYQYRQMDVEVLGGSIVVMGNTFSQICGAENIDASIMLIGVRHDIYDDYANQRGHFPVMEKAYFKSKFFNTYYQEDQEEFFKDGSITHPQIGEIHLVRMGVNISGNIYENICMGPEVYDQIKDSSLPRQLRARGSLASFIFISQVHMYNETFIDIGPFSYNYSVNLQKQIKNINSIQPRYPWKGAEVGEMSTVPSYLKSSLSTSLLVVQYGQQIIMGGCHFDNIWLIDRLYALSRSQAQGLILYVEIFDGEVILGSPDKSMVLQNLYGFLNDRNIEKMREEFYLNNSIDEQGRYVQHGVGSILFNLHNSSNSYIKIQMQNVEIKDSYFCANKATNYAHDSRTSAILSTYLADEGYSNIPEDVTITDISITDVNFEGISNYFEILGQFVIFQNISIKGIGLKDFPASSNQTLEYIGSDRVQRDAKFSTSFFKIFLYISETRRQGWIEIYDFTLININPSSGAFPVFSFDKTYNRLPEDQSVILMSYIEFKDSLLMDATVDEDLLPKGSLFRIETAGLVNLIVFIQSLSMTKVFSKCNFLFNLHIYRWPFRKFGDNQ